LAQLTALREFQGYDAERGTKAEPGSDSEWTRQSKESGETKMASVHKIQYQRGERYTEKPLEICRVPLKHSTEY